MRVAITGGTGFVGRHLAAKLHDHEVVTLSRSTGHHIDDSAGLAHALQGVDVIVHTAGINREIGDQTYQRVHVDGTRALIEAAHSAGVQRLVMLSYVLARPLTGFSYHESKWQAEELVRNSGLDYTILKAGMIYGPGDHLLDHISRAVRTFPFFPAVGLHERYIRPVPIDEMTDILRAAALYEHFAMRNQTVTVLGAEQLLLTDVVRRTAKVLNRHVTIFPLPVVVHYTLAHLFEATMRVPLVAVAQVKMLADGVDHGHRLSVELPPHLQPQQPFTPELIRAGISPEGRFGLKDLLLLDRLRLRKR